MQKAVQLPPLRSRREDVLLLLAHFYPEIGQLLSTDLVHALLLCEWRDNVRALRATADRLRIDGDTETLRSSLWPRPGSGVEIADGLAPLPVVPPRATSTPLPQPASVVSPPARPYRLPSPPREQLVTLLTKHLGTLVNVAKELGCSRRQVQRWLDQYGLDADTYRTKPG